jgi:hypothetical protein
MYTLSSLVQQTSWSDDTVHDLPSPVSMGQRPNDLLMWKSHQATSDYDQKMNQQNYEKWVREKLVANLPRTPLWFLIT